MKHGPMWVTTKGPEQSRVPEKDITHETSEEVGHISHDSREGKARLDERTFERVEPQLG